ncbi:hypothetical protein [Epilithonimonas hominis]|uniref:hypothetical protein n=1 Tax=Epilithonimonas hominis TaxID=420404 RepID=UPI00289C9DBB|nr:hypothetical protein [Epilithonimonas hominis]
MQENNYTQTKNYFKNLAEQSNFINDFVGFFRREWLDRVSSTMKLKSPILALYDYRLGFDGPEQKTSTVRKVGFAIMFNNVKSGDLEGQYNAINEAEIMAVKILSRIRLDSYKENHMLYNAFLKDSVEISPVELSGNEFGVEVTFNLKNIQSLKVFKEDWKDIENICS